MTLLERLDALDAELAFTETFDGDPRDLWDYQDALRECSAQIMRALLMGEGDRAYS